MNQLARVKKKLERVSSFSSKSQKLKYSRPRLADRLKGLLTFKVLARRRLDCREDRSF